MKIVLVLPEHMAADAFENADHEELLIFGADQFARSGFSPGKNSEAMRSPMRQTVAAWRSS